MLPTYEAYKAKADVDIKGKKETLSIAEASTDPDAAALKVKELKDQMAKYIEDHTDYFKEVSSKEVGKERVKYQLDYLFGLRSVYDYTINPNHSLNTAVWKAIANVLKPHLPAKFAQNLGR
jgi:hypothetical protein